MKNIMIGFSILVLCIVAAVGTTTRVRGTDTLERPEAAAHGVIDGAAAEALQLERGAPEACNEASASDDASCADGGWHRSTFDGCCSSPLGRGKWWRNMEIKCCGACAF